MKSEKTSENADDEAPANPEKISSSDLHNDILRDFNTIAGWMYDRERYLKDKFQEYKIFDKGI